MKSAGCATYSQNEPSTGGVAMNRAVVKLMGDRLGLPISLPPDPQITGALGAALFAKRMVA